VHHFLAIFSKVHEFVQNMVFSPRPARFVIFALGAPLSSVFSKVHSFLQIRVFLARDQHVLSFLHLVHHFTIFIKLDEFVQNSILIPRSARFVIFALSTPLSSDFQQVGPVSPKQRVQSRRSARFVIFAVGAPLFSNFQQSARVCTKQKFFIFVIFLLGAPRFSDFQQSARVCTKQKFSARGQHVSSFSHWAHHLLAIFSKMRVVLQNTIFSPKSGRFVIFALGAPLLSHFQQSARVGTKMVLIPRSAFLSCVINTFEST